MTKKNEAQWVESVDRLRASAREVEGRLRAPNAESYAWAYGYLSSAVSRLLKDHTPVAKASK